MKPKLANRDALKDALEKIQAHVIDQPEARLMFAVYERGMRDYEDGVRGLHKQCIRLRTFQKKSALQLKRLEFYMSGKLACNQKNLDALTEHSAETRKALVRVAEAEHKIDFLRCQKRRDYRFLTNPKNRALLLCGIEPNYVIRLLGGIGFFESSTN